MKRQKAALTKHKISHQGITKRKFHQILDKQALSLFFLSKHSIYIRMKRQTSLCSCSGDLSCVIKGIR